MRRKRSGVIMSTLVVLLAILSLSTCDGVRRNAHRRKDSFRSASALQMPAPTAESLQALAEATGAAGFEHYTEGRALVKRLIPLDQQPDLDVVEHQGVIGKAGVDFPAYPSIPYTGFSCKNVPTGYYADLETDCQVFHICDTSRKISFLCPNGTIFSQSHLICDWWFKVDCASSPALYESSAEYYSNEQKRSRKVTQSLSKNHDLQQIGTDTNVRAESRRAPVNVPKIPSTTERFLKHRQKLQNDFGSPLNTANNVKATARSFQAFFTDKNFNPTQKSQATTAFDKKRKNLVQLITNTFGNSKTTLPSYSEASTYRSTLPVVDNVIKEMQVAAETASFAANNNRQFLQDYNSKNFRPYPVYTPNLPKVSKTKSNPNLTTLYDIRDKHLDEYIPDSTTKRSTLIPYTKSYTNILNEKLEPYTRPGVSLLKGFLEKEKNKTHGTPTEAYTQVTERSDKIESKFSHDKKIAVESRDSFETATKIPQTTRSDTNYFADTASSDRHDRTDSAQTVTESTYQERRERLLKKLNFETFSPTEPTLPTLATEKFYGNLPNRPGLVVPPSLTPKTLHTLAIYYATALDNLSTTLSPEESDTTTQPIDEYDAISDSLPALFSSQTINKYDSLFRQGEHNAELLEEIRLDPNGTYNELADDLSVQQSQNPLAASPQIRELAQVFTHALSAYLQDPVQFRKVLSDIRPTQPSFGDILTTEEPSDAEPTTTVNEDDEEILGFSDDNKIRPALASLRDSKALNIATDYTTLDQPTTTITPSTKISSTFPPATSPRNPFRCCGRISASYTTASTPKEVTTLPGNFTNLSSTITQTTTTAQDNSYTISKFGGFQNNSAQNDSPYGKGLNPIGAKPLSEYVQATNLPNAWGVDIPASTLTPNLFESKKIKKTSPVPITTTPIYFTETDSFELENEEELQRAHSQSFVGPKNNEIRQGKQLNTEEATTIVQIPSDDLEVPTISDIETTTAQVTYPSTTVKVAESESTTASSEFSSIFTSPDSDIKTTNELSWPNTFENWHSTVILDPFTVNDGLSSTGPDSKTNQQTDQTNSWTTNVATTPSAEYAETSEAAYSSTINVEVSSPANKIESRFGRLLREPTVTESGTDFTTIADTVAQKAKEIMGGMNSTTTEKLMNVMKKTKSKSVKRLILLLIQTCDDDHNTTAEASKKALLEALMAVSQKDMDEIASESDTDNPLAVSTIEFSTSTTLDSKAEPIERQELRPKQSDRRGKSLEFDATAINALSNPSTTESITTTEIVPETISTTQSPKTTPAVIRRGAKKFLVRTGPVEPKVDKVTFVDIPRAEARVAPEEPETKTSSDTRALELLRSLYTIAARWG